MKIAEENETRKKLLSLNKEAEKRIHLAAGRAADSDCALVAPATTPIECIFDRTGRVISKDHLRAVCIVRASETSRHTIEKRYS